MINQNLKLKPHRIKKDGRKTLQVAPAAACYLGAFLLYIAIFALLGKDS